MKVCLTLPIESRGLERVENALVRYAPDRVSLVRERSQADLVILHVIGRNDKVREAIRSLRRRRKKYAVIQYCLRSTLRPSTSDWMDLWKDAKLVWSYYDLPALCTEDGTRGVFEFYHAPLGVNAGIFYPRDRVRGEFIIATSGMHALTESVKECVVAAKKVGRRVFHLGHQLRRGDDIVCRSGITDQELAGYFSSCEFVSGLRRTEGFELPVAEGLLCGARPILFNQPHYRQWYSNLALFIPEEPREKITETLVKVFEAGASPVTKDEMKEAEERFNWKKIASGFWERVLV